MSASGTQATLSRMARGRGVLVLSADQTQQLLLMVAGKSVTEAQALPREQPGLAQALVTVDPPGTTVLPSDPSQITLTLVGEDIAG